MNSDSFEDWLSLFDNDAMNAWNRESKELRRISMIFLVLEKEISRVKDGLSQEISDIKSDLKRRDFFKKCSNFEELAQSEEIRLTPEDKENIPSPKPLPLHECDLNEATNELFIESPNTSSFFGNRTPERKSDITQITQSSPTINKTNSYYKRLSSSSPSLMFFPVITRKVEKTPKQTESKESTPKNVDVVDCSIIENTPNIRPTKKAKNSKLLLQSRNKSKLKPKLSQKSQKSTLTQMFNAPKKEIKKEQKKAIDSECPSMEIDSILDYVNNQSSGDETIASSPAKSIGDATVDNLELTPEKLDDSQDAFQVSVDFIQNYNKLPEVKKESPVKNIVRGNERKKLKGWSCKDCENYYAGMNLPPDELEKRKDQCSKHRSNAKPREDTFPGYWDFTFGPSPKTQEAERPLRSYKK